MAHTLAYALRVCGDLDVAALRRAFQALIDRHAVLRATFTELSGDPAQQIHAHVTAPFVHDDASDWSDAAVSARLGAEAPRPFDLEQGPLTRLHLFTRAAREHLLLLTLHELVADARSLQILLPELETLYLAETTGVPAPLATPIRQYTDDVRRRNETLAGPEGERLWSYWQRQLAGAPLMLDLPTSRPRTSVRTQDGASHTLALGAALTAALKTLARHEGVALDTLLLAAFQALLSRYTGQEDIVVGSLLDGLAGDGADGGPFAAVVGYHADPLPLRVDLAGDPPFTELLRRVRETVRDAHAHRDYPVALLIERLRPARVPGYAPLAQVLFEWRQARALAMGDLTPLLLGVSGPPLRFGDLTLEPLALDRRATPLDLTLRMGEVAGEIVASFEYNTDLFDAPMIARLAGHLRVMLAGVVADPARRLSALPLLTPAEREQLLVEWNGAMVPYPRDRCDHQLVEEQCALTPDAVTIEYGDERITNRELDERTNQLAHYLQKAGVGPEALVGVCLEPSPELFVAQLGVLKAGGGYVLLDPALPEERMAFMLADTQAAVLVTQRSLRERVPSSYAGRVVCVDTEAAAIAQEPTQPVVSSVTPDNAAAVTYTSGSTGQPKGVLRSHVLALAGVGQPSGGTTRVGGIDATTNGAIALSMGGTLVLNREDVRHDPGLLLRFLCDQRITVTSLPGVVIQQLAEVSAREGLVPADLRQIRTVGEQLRITPEIVRFFEHMPECVLRNLYGSTEGGIATAYTLDGPPSAWPTLPPIGRAIPNAQVYLLDGRLQPVPIGVTGELYVGGAALARGYLNRPELTGERFIPHPFSDESGARLYKTGDLARYRPDGNIEIVGRGDHQVKLRAFRIELGEIETTLRAHPDVADAVALAREDTPGSKRLVAYVVPRPGRAPGHSALRAFVAARLPDYMVPAAYVTLDALPRTPNGITYNLSAVGVCQGVSDGCIVLL